MWSDESSNGFSEILRNIDIIPYGSHWLQCFRVTRLFQISPSHTGRESVYIWLSITSLVHYPREIMDRHNEHLKKYLQSHKNGTKR